jgi:acyl transferase domain-containing protein/NAD(P)H-dependent flavin oxidoreductase YrpB (nitropropane dioxygenase family)/NAD(P)-dependent dehydrogenase (short-subunit alcohol dehydrogenase family)
MAELAVPTGNSYWRSLELEWVGRDQEIVAGPKIKSCLRRPLSHPEQSGTSKYLDISTHELKVMQNYNLIAITPFQYPDARLVIALDKAGVLGVLDPGFDTEKAKQALSKLIERIPCQFGVVDRGSIETSLVPLDAVIILPGPDYSVACWSPRPVLAQVTSLNEALRAEASGAFGLIAKGNESGGRVGMDTAFILLQQILANTKLPVWVQGGIGSHTAAACIVGGARGVVIDSQLVLAKESQLPSEIKKVVALMDGSETAVIGGYRVYQRPDLKEALPANEVDIGQRLGANSLQTNLLPSGQDAALAVGLANRYVTAGGIVTGIRSSMNKFLAQAKELRCLSPGAALAVDHGITFPVFQGPMTRVSDTAEFAAAVAQGGGLPFIALALLRAERARKLLLQTSDLLGDRPWGVGILGFVDPALQAEQLAVIEEVRPPVALIAGGRPSQARNLEEKGIATYLHVPSPGLLKLFLADGSRRFIFEGRECGGHVGPRSSFILWEQQLDVLLQFERPAELCIVFAGGIHDSRSAAMVATMAAPLAAKGAKIGILMGTSYLYTHEAVTSRAILPYYQQAAIECKRTVLLETGPGHASRCVDTNFVSTFAFERQRLEAEGATQDTIWRHLEQLNLGRLRIASKGVKRDGTALVEVDETEQRREGMYMIGDVAMLDDQTSSIDELHRRVTEGACDYLANLPDTVPDRRDPAPVDVAIIGMAAVFPGAGDLETYWSNIVKGFNAITEVDPERWNPEFYYDPNSRNGDKTPSKWGGFIQGVIFNPLDYGIPPQSLTTVDPTQLLSLEIARRALDDAGYAAREFDRSRVSVVFGAESGADISAAYGFRSLHPQLLGPLPPALDEHLPRLREDSFPGVLANVIAGRIANRLDLGGANFTVDAACASSLAALDSAIKELVIGTSDMVLCGGADLHNGINDYLLFAGVHALSRVDHCRTFDSKADGTVLGEGVGCLVLKRLADAERDGDRIYAVVKSIAASSDGRSLGLTAPSKGGQMRALERAYARAGLSPKQVGLVEAHGTGTVVGDRTELSSLTDTFLASGAAIGGCAIGSVKSQIGHTKCAAGLAGIIKATKALHHRILPPTINILQPNPAYDPDTSPFAISDRARPWLREERHAGVNAFGFGGSNFTAVLSAYEQAEEPDYGYSHWPCELFLFRGTNRHEAEVEARKVIGVLDTGYPITLRDLAASISANNGGKVHFSIVAASITELRAGIQSVLSGQAEGRGVALAEAIDGKLAFLFPGQGSQRPGMLRELFVAFPHLQRLLVLGAPWRDALFPPTAWTEDQALRQKAAIKDTRTAQPALGIAGLAVADLFSRAGVRPDMAGGHSYGELVALCLAGTLSEEDLLPLSHERAVAMLESAGGHPGAMAAVSAGVEKVRNLLKGLPDVVIANINSPEQTVISGTNEGLAEAIRRCDSQGVAARQLQVAAAFHSPIVASGSKRLRNYLEGLTLRSPSFPVWSNTSAQPYVDEPDAIRDQLAQHIANPVLFLEQIESMYANGARIFVETGPGKVLSGLVGRILGDRTHTVISSDTGGDSGIRDFLMALGRLASLGIEVDTHFLFAGRGARRLNFDDPSQLALPSVAWRINGWLARPINGQLPTNRLRPTLGPVCEVLPGPSPMAVSSDREETVLQYLRGLRELAAAQRDVMLGYLGAPLPASNQEIPSRQVPPRPKPQTQERTITPNARLSAGTADTPAARQSVADTLLAIVSDKTGYPKDMLGLDLDLEAELSIDSIKRVEVLGVLAERLGLDATTGGDRDYIIEQLAAKKTLREIINWLEMQPASQATNAAQPHAGQANSTLVSTKPAVDLTHSLLAIVSEKTGYPKYMLGLDQDLEAELSIDSIKRVEILGALAGQLGIGDSGGEDRDYVIEQLAAKKTLREIIAWLEQQSANTAASQVHDTPVTASTSFIRPEVDLTKALLGIVSEKTGYPTDMLGLDQDLEAELSIDSIKRVEILGALAAQQGIGQAGSDDRDYIIEELAARKTLREIIIWIEKRDQDSARDATPSAGMADEARSQTSALRRYLPRVQPLAPAVSDLKLLVGQHYFVTEPNSDLARELIARLTELGAKVEGLEKGLALTASDGLLYLGALAATNGVEPVKELFDLSQQAITQGIQGIFALTGLGGGFGQIEGATADLPSDFRGAGIAGLIKSAAKERPSMRMRVIAVDPRESPRRIADTVLSELVSQDGLIEVGYVAGQRYRVIPVATELEAEVSGSDLELDKDSVVLVTGGARGITANAAVELARQTGCKLVLVGRSPLPGPEAPIYASAVDMPELRRKLIEEGSLRDPKAIEASCRCILAEREVRATLDALATLGSSFEYHSLDVRDSNAFGAFIRNLYMRHRRIDAVIHGAGVIEDKLIVDKSRESFDRVYDTKVTSARTLMSELREDVKYIVFFSSVSGAFGNRGQADYASAGDVLDKLAWSHAKRNYTRLVSIDWGPWASTGMVSDQLAKEYARRGIGLIPLEEGIESLLREMVAGNRDDVQVIIAAAAPTALAAHFLDA